MKTGIQLMSNAAYHGGPGLSSSDLKELLKSPAHFRAYKEKKNEPTPEMLKGTLVHALILEPEKFDQEFFVADFKIRRGKEYDTAVKAAEGRTVVSVEELTEARIIVNAFEEQKANNKELQALLQGVKELSFFWEDPATGVLLKCRPDNLTAFGAVVDIKTARDASFDAFQKTIVDLGYYISAAHYLRGVTAVHATIPQPSAIVPVVPTQFVCVVIETKAPYAVAIYSLSAKALQIGAARVDKALEAYSQAVATDTWEAYSKKAIEIDLPNWAYFKMNKE